MLRYGILTLVCAALPAQVILEHSVAAAAGSLAGGMAGKRLSDSIDKALNSEGLKEAAGGQFMRPDSASASRITRMRQTNLGPVTAPSAPPTFSGNIPASPRSRRGPARVEEQREATAALGNVPALPSLMWIPTISPAMPEPSAEDLRLIQVGAARQDVLDKLGKPASKVNIAAEDGLQEIYYFTSQGSNVGTVRLLNGKVVSIRAN